MTPLGILCFVLSLRCCALSCLSAVQMFMFLALARGWGTTRAYLPQDTWRLHLCLSFSFYVCLTVFSRYLHHDAFIQCVHWDALFYSLFLTITARSLQPA